MNPTGKRLAVAAALVLLTAALYLPVLHYGFIGFDDGLYVYENEHVKGGLTAEGLRWAFTDTSLGFWHPLTLISHQTDVALFGLDPAGHHLSALLLHLAATLLLFLPLVALTGTLWPAALAACLFAVHPLHVEAVVWIAERKELLAGFFWVATVAAYLAYVRRPGFARYGAAFFLFFCGMLSKPMLVTLPFVLLLLDCWPLGRLRFPAAMRIGPGDTAALKLVWEKAPFLLVSFGLSLVAFFAESRVGALLPEMPLATRAAYVPIAYLGYLRQTVWPQGLTLFYPHPGAGVPTAKAVAAGVVLLGISAAVLGAFRRRPYLAVGWFWFIGTLVPVIGLVQVGSHFMADRYTYVPLVGVFMMVAWAGRDVVGAHPRWKRPALAAAAPALFLLYVAASLQVRHWRGDISLYRHAIAVTEGNWLAHNNLAVAYLKQGKIAEGMLELEASLRIRPGQPLVRANLGEALERSGRVEQAIEVYRRGLEQPEGADAMLLTRLGTALARLGRTEEARSRLEEALDLNPQMGEAHYYLGSILMLEEQPDRAIPHFRRAAQLDPGDFRAHYYLGLTLMESGHPEEAEAALRKACSLDPGSEKARALLALAVAARSAQERGAAPPRLVPGSGSRTGR